MVAGGAGDRVAALLPARLHLPRLPAPLRGPQPPSAAGPGALTPRRPALSSAGQPRAGGGGGRA